MKSKKLLIGKTKLLRLAICLVLVLILTATALTAEPVYEVLNPRGTAPDVTQVPLSPRLQDLGGKVIYVIDSGIYGAFVFTEKLAELLPKYLPPDFDT